MKRIHARVASLLVLSLLTVSAFSIVGAEDEPEEESNGEVPVEWAVLVYLTADNNLDELTEQDLNEFMSIGSNDQVKVLILMDKLELPAQLLYVEQNNLVVVENEDLNDVELNMGDPWTMRTFVECSFEMFEQERTLLYLWDHGSAVRGVGVDDTPGDLEGSDWLSHQELISALENIKVDIIAADECLVGQMEVAYEYASSGLLTEYLVASEGYIGWRGFPYDAILDRMQDEPTMETVDVAKIIAEEFQELFRQPPYQSEILTSQTVIDLSKAVETGEKTWVMADLLIDNMDDCRAIIDMARYEARLPWGETSVGIYDFKTLVSYLAENVEDSDVVVACEDVVAMLDQLVVSMGTTMITEMMPCEGVGIFVPNTYGQYQNALVSAYALYPTFGFAEDGWLEFLYSFWNESSEEAGYFGK